MAIPDAIKKQGEQADKIQQDLIQGQVVDVVDAPQPDKPKKEEPPKKKDKPEDKKQPVKEPPDKPAPPSDDVQGQINALQQKHDTLAGRFSAYREQSERELDTARETIANLNQLLLEKLDKEKKSTDDDGKSAPDKKNELIEAILKGVDPSLFDSYGDEMVDLVKIVNAQAEIIKNMSDRLDGFGTDLTATSKKVDNVNKDLAETAEEEFWTEFERLAPDYENSDGWKLWLSKIDPFSNEERQDLLEKAVQAKDAKRVARFWNSYKKDAGLEKTKPETPLGDQPNKDDEDDILADQLMPDTDTDSGEPSAPPKEVTLAHYQKAIDDKIHDRITEKDFNKIANAYARSAVAKRKKAA